MFMTDNQIDFLQPSYKRETITVVNSKWALTVFVTCSLYPHVGWGVCTFWCYLQNYTYIYTLKHKICINNHNHLKGHCYFIRLDLFCSVHTPQPHSALHVLTGLPVHRARWPLSQQDCNSTVTRTMSSEQLRLLFCRREGDSIFLTCCFALLQTTIPASVSAVYGIVGRGFTLWRKGWQCGQVWK